MTLAGRFERVVATDPSAAQALHWFDLLRFFTAVRQAARPGALLEKFRQCILRSWGDPAQPRAISWPLAIRAGTV